MLFRHFGRRGLGLVCLLMTMCLALPAFSLAEGLLTPVADTQEEESLTDLTQEETVDEAPAEEAAPAPTEAPQSYLTFDTTEVTLTKGKSITLKPVAYGFTLPKKSTAFTWSTSKSTIVKVSKAGKVTAAGGGEGYVWCSCTVDGVTYTAECHVVVNVTATSVTAPDTEVLLMVGETGTPKFTVKPADTTDPSLSFESASPEVATVDADGVVTAVAPGTAKITATTLDGSNKKKSVTVRVITLQAEEEVTVPLVGGEVIRVNYLGSVANFKSNIKVSTKSTCFKVTTDFDDNGVLLTVIPSKIGTGTITITDSKAKNSKVTLTVTVDNLATSRSVPYVSDASLDVSALMIASTTLVNPGLEEITDFSLRFVYLDSDGQQIFAGQSGKDDLKKEQLTLQYKGSVTAGSEIPTQDRVPSAYSDAVRLRVALDSYTTASGRTFMVPEESLRWYDTELGELPSGSDVGAVTLSDEEKAAAEKLSMGYNSVPLYEGFAQHYGAPYSGRWITVLGDGSMLRSAGALVDDVIYGVDDVLWKDDPYVIERAKARLAKGEKCVFHLCRDGKTIDITVSAK